MPKPNGLVGLWPTYHERELDPVIWADRLRVGARSKNRLRQLPADERRSDEFFVSRLNHLTSHQPGRPQD